jgi:hypothetical protein
MVLRYFLSDAIGQAVGQFILLRLPIHCYLIGRYILEQSMAEVTGAIFAVAHLLWRLSQTFAKPYRLDLIYFMLCSEHELEQVYSKFDCDKSFEIITRDDNQLHPLDRLLLTTMCYRIKQPNRTRQAHSKLRRIIAKITLFVAIIVVPTTIVLTISFTILALTDDRYLYVHPNCDPELQQLKDDHKLSSWSMTPTSHHMISLAGDYFENIAIWCDSGIVTTVAPASMFLLSYDLVMHWNRIKKKIKLLEHLLRNQVLEPEVEVVWLEQAPSRHKSS